MIFGPKNTKSNKKINIKIDGQSLETATKTKFLGIIIDNKLTWKEHALYTSNKMSKSIAILSIARKYLDTKTMLQLYYSFVFPYLHYCNLAWGNASDSTLWPVFRSQKIALRIISNTPKKSSTINFCNKNLILRLPDIYKNSVGLFMFKFKNNLLPNIFDTFFSQNDRFHTYPTRNATQLRAP